MIIIVRAFLKELSRFNPDIRKELVSLVSKHDRGLSKSFILLKKEENLFIFKGYLDGKRVRITVAKTAKGNYIPLEILRKESRGGYNIRDDYDSSSIINRVNQEIIEDRYDVWDLTE